MAIVKDKDFRIDICKKISEIHDKFCSGCEDPKRLRGEANYRNMDIHYCVKHCEHGIKIKRYGDMLEGNR